MPARRSSQEIPARTAAEAEHAAAQEELAAALQAVSVARKRLALAKRSLNDLARYFRQKPVRIVRKTNVASKRQKFD